MQATYAGQGMQQVPIKICLLWNNMRTDLCYSHALYVVMQASILCRAGRMPGCGYSMHTSGYIAI